MVQWVVTTPCGGVGTEGHLGDRPDGATAPRGRRQQEVRDLAEKRLQSNPYLALKNVSCEYSDGVLTLRGRLPTYYLRQIAQAAVSGMDGVRAVVDCIEVVPATARGGRREARSEC